MDWKRVLTVLIVLCSSFVLGGIQEGTRDSNRVEQEVYMSKENQRVEQLPKCVNQNRRQPEQAEHEGDNMDLDLEVVKPPIDILDIIPAKGIKKVSGERQFLVTTLDGKLTLLDGRGGELWSINTGELFTSTISSLQLSENGKWVNLIPSLTGGLYKYDEEDLTPMPMNVDSLLHKSFKLSNDVVINGGKELRTLGIDLRTGRLRYDCGISGCTSPETNELEEAGADDPVTLVVKKQLQTVRAVDTQSGTEKWNFSVGVHEMGLTGVMDGCVQEEDEEVEGRPLGFVKVVIPEGRLLSVDPSTKRFWDRKFSSPIAQAWVLENGKLTYVDPLQNTPLKEGPLALYVGRHNHQFYVQESRQLVNKLETIMGYPNFKNVNEDSPPKIAWRPSYLVNEDLSITETEAVTALTPLRPSIRPFYVLEKDEIILRDDGVPAIENGQMELEPITPEMQGSTPPPLDDSDVEDEEDEDLPFFNFGDEDGPIQIINEVVIASLWVWWKEVLGISLFTALLLNILLMRPLVRVIRIRAVRDVLLYIRELAMRRNQQDGQIIPKNDSRVLPVMGASTSDSVPATSSTLSRPRTISLNSSYNEGVVENLEKEIPYISQYLREFDPIQCLGRGGFGVVFEAKKKIDDRHYAVKRIALPNREQARVRVMREVKALAQLDHRNTVRYFNAWIEHPPNGWLEKNDPLWTACAIGSMSPTVEEPLSDFFSSSRVNEPKGRSRKTTLLAGGDIDFDAGSPVVDEGDQSSYIVFEETYEHRSKRDLHNDVHMKIPDPLPEVSEGDVSSDVSGGGLWKKPSFGSASWNITSDQSLCRDPEVVIETLEDEDEDGVEVGEEAKETKNVSVMYLYIQQELCQKRTLRDWLRTEKTRDVQIVVNFFSQIVDAVEYVHSKKLIHRDLKPSNIFLAEEHVVKIGDFGLATTLLDVGGTTAGAKSADKEAEAKENNLTSQVGTQLYMSPEQSKRKPYDYKVDIYSLGLIFFELLVPFSTEMERHEMLCQVRKVRIPSYFMDDYPQEHSMIVKMISHNPNNRPDATAISSWVKDHLKNLESGDCGKTTPYRSNSSPGKIALNRGSSDSSSSGNIVLRQNAVGAMGGNKFHKSHSFASL